MTGKNAQKTFEKYNPAEAVTRCPNGRANVRKQLDLYARAAVNLYGVIPITDFVRIFNSQNEAQTDGEEVFLLLLPIVLKEKRYCFYGGCIVHYWAADDFGYADYLLREQSGKPGYTPDKDEFLKYEDKYYEDEPQRTLWRKVSDFLDKEFSDNPRRYRVFNELRGLSSQRTGLRETTEILDKFDIVFRGEEQVREFFCLLMEACNNTRLRENKGYTPNELMNLMAGSLPKDHSDEIVVRERKKVGRNDLCPCGSGRKYKHCCLLTEEARTAQLTASECALFYTTWYGLMGFINEKKKVINARIKPMYPNAISDEQIYKVREVLWKTPELITDYLSAAKPPSEITALLESWRDRHKKGMFFILDYKPGYAVIIDSDDNGKDRLLGIKGISRSLSDTMRCELPAQIEAVLLPFKDKIIYDGFISSMPVGFAEGAKNMLGDMYNNALKYGIITQGEKL